MHTSAPSLFRLDNNLIYYENVYLFLFLFYLVLNIVVNVIISRSRRHWRVVAVVVAPVLFVMGSANLLCKFFVLYYYQREGGFGPHMLIYY